MICQKPFSMTVADVPACGIDFTTLVWVQGVHNDDTGTPVGDAGTIAAGFPEDFCLPCFQSAETEWGGTLTYTGPATSCCISVTATGTPFENNGAGSQRYATYQLKVSRNGSQIALFTGLGGDANNGVLQKLSFNVPLSVAATIEVYARIYCESQNTGAGWGSLRACNLGMVFNVGLSATCP